MPRTLTNTDALRIAAGLALVYGNGLILTLGPPSALWGAPFSRFGIDMLFALGGFSSARAWRARPELGAYVTGRLRRVWPGLAICVLFTIGVIGPLATGLAWRRYALDGLTRDYLHNLLFMPRLWLPGVFPGQQWVGTVNPMLWMLAPGLLCGCVLPVGTVLWRWLGAWTFALLLAAALLALVVPPLHGTAAAVLRHDDVLTELPFFFVAVALAHAPERWWRADVAMLLFAGNWVSATWLGEGNYAFECLSLPYLLGCFGRMSMPGLGQLGRLGHPGYGLFLYAFPLQQLIVFRWPACPAPIALCAMLSLAAGYASWHLVERPALRLTARALTRFRLAPA